MKFKILLSLKNNKINFRMLSATTLLSALRVKTSLDIHMYRLFTFFSFHYVTTSIYPNYLNSDSRAYNIDQDQINPKGAV